MKRSLVLAGAFLLFGCLFGCGADSRIGLIDDTINLVQQAAADVGNIKSKVNEAIKKAEEKGTKLDLTDAGKVADQLKKLGETAQKIKRNIELDRASITDEDKVNYVEKRKGQLESAFADLLKQRNDLNKSLAKAEQINQAAKKAVEDLRDKMRDAESPFEALAR
jgi:chromosome segregation ATPase